ncbi:SRPBCC family protein [Propionibacteriaceae bacterium Y1923]
MTEDRTVAASRVVRATPQQVFAVVADPRRHPDMDGRGNTTAAQDATPITAAGVSFLMLNSNGKVRENRVVEFEADRLVAWMPCPVGGEPFGFLWRWAAGPNPDDSATSVVTHSYDWTTLTREDLFEEARSVSVADLDRSLARLAALLEN